MFSNSNLTIRFLVGAVVASLLLLLAIGGGTGFIAVLYLNNQITSLSSDFASLSGPAREHASLIYQQAQSAFSYFLMACVAITVFAGIVCLTAYSAAQNGILRPLAAMVSAMRDVADQKYDTKIPGLGLSNEIGLLASALEVFKTNGIERQRLTERELQEAKRQGERSRYLDGRIHTFNDLVASVVGSVAASAVRLKSNAETLSKAANDTSTKANAVESAASHANRSVQTVAGSAEEMTQSIGTISRRVSDATQRAEGAAVQAEKSRDTIHALSDAAEKIGVVVQLVQAIASQTNLLALNATIEAARAGEAGRGFAVVASEVKELAGQTAKATEEIAGQVTSIQAATTDCVKAIEDISQTIREISSIATTIAAAVEQQDSATREIARSVQQVAAGTTEVSQNVAGASQAAEQSRKLADNVSTAAGELGRHAGDLFKSVDNFLGRLRNAA